MKRRYIVEFSGDYNNTEVHSFSIFEATNELEAREVAEALYGKMDWGSAVLSWPAFANEFDAGNKEWSCD